jgi:hypothetical protein
MSAALLTNILFWSGVAIGGVVFAALLEVTSGDWSGPLRLIAERFRWFLPISLLTIVVVMWRSDAMYPWARQPTASGWFTPWFVALRVDVACAAVYAAGFAFCRASERSRAPGSGRSGAATKSAIVFLIVYAVGFSLIAVDMIMSLEPRWTSTLFPAYVFTGNVFAGIAAVAVLATWRRGGSTVVMSATRARDTANLLGGVALFWLYLFWSQFLVIWYGNLTAEVNYLMARRGSLQTLGWLVIVLACAVPAAVLVPQRGKRARAVKIVAAIILAGMWLERWILVAPDVPSRSPALALLTTAAFAAAFFVAVRPRSNV